VSLRRRVALRLRAAGVPSPDADAAALIEYVSGSRSPFVELAAEQDAQLEDLVAKRCRRVPLQHLTGSAGFRYLDLEVGPGVFVPRPETEVLVDIALQEPFDRAVDLCTGSAAIALSLATETGADVVAVEVDPLALQWARRNAAGRVEVLVADVCADDLSHLGPVDLVVSNPPYIPEAMVPRDPEVALHDPPLPCSAAWTDSTSCGACSRRPAGCCGPAAGCYSNTGSTKVRRCGRCSTASTRCARGRT
jgi:release factor glutamine methyltransferase